MKQKISATIVADSIGPKGDRITTFLLVFPRFILAELNTHRMFSRNSASSRAIPFKRMIEAVKTDPFIPIAWQKDHSGMQGNEYITDQSIIDFKTGIWLQMRDEIIHRAEELNGNVTKCTSPNDCEEILGTGVTKQICNRPLEAFMWHTCLVTSTEWENFFSLRCPQYHSPVDTHFRHRSKKDCIAAHSNPENLKLMDSFTVVDWLKINEGQAEIHMMALAEAMWDAYNEGTPEFLEAGQWHIPYKKKIDPVLLKEAVGSSQTEETRLSLYQNATIHISTAMCARTSYTTIGDEKEVSYERLIQIHDSMYNQNPFHASPFEHIAQAMNTEQYYSHIKGKVYSLSSDPSDENPPFTISGEGSGWCDNFRGFISYRHMVEKERRLKNGT